MGERWFTPKGPMYRGVVHRWAYHREAHLTEADVAHYPGARERLLTSWDPYWQKPQASHRVEKSPSNVMKTRFLQAVFPGSRFVMITRHPIIQGLAARKWGDRVHRAGFRFEDFLRHWLTAMETFRADQPHLETSLTIRYEDLIADPSGTMTQVQSAIGLPRADIDVSEVGESSDEYRRYWRAYRGREGKLFHLEKRRKKLRGRIDQSLELAHGLLRGERIHQRLVDRYEERVQAFGYSLERLR